MIIDFICMFGCFTNWRQRFSFKALTSHTVRKKWSNSSLSSMPYVFKLVQKTFFLLFTIPNSLTIDFSDPNNIFQCKNWVIQNHYDCFHISVGTLEPVTTRGLWTVTSTKRRNCDREILGGRLFLVLIRGHYIFTNRRHYGKTRGTRVLDLVNPLNSRNIYYDEWCKNI